MDLSIWQDGFQISYATLINGEPTGYPSEDQRLGKLPHSSLANEPVVREHIERASSVDNGVVHIGSVGLEGVPCIVDQMAGGLVEPFLEMGKSLLWDLAGLEFSIVRAVLPELPKMMLF